MWQSVQRLNKWDIGRGGVQGSSLSGIVYYIVIKMFSCQKKNFLIKHITKLKVKTTKKIYFFGKEKCFLCPTSFYHFTLRLLALIILICVYSTPAFFSNHQIHSEYMLVSLFLGKLVLKSLTFMTFSFKSRTKRFLFKCSNFHNFCFYISNFHFNCISGIKTTSFCCVMLYMVYHSLKKNQFYLS